MSNIIQLGSIQSDLKDVGTDNHGMGSDYYRRKQKTTEPYYVENLDFDESVQKEFPNRDYDVEQYLVDQAIQRGQNPNRPFQKSLRGLDWSRGNDKIRTEYWDPQALHNVGRNRNGAYYYNAHKGKPVIRMYNQALPYVHEFSHHLYNFQDNPQDPRNVVKIPESSSSQGSDSMKSWRSDPSEIQAEASKAKRRYVHREVPKRVKWGESIGSPSFPAREHVNFMYNVEPFDKDHPAIKEGKQIPDDVVDDMFKSWMDEDGKGWGESYRKNPKEFPVELFKEALRLGKNDQKPGLFTGKRSYYA